MRWAPPNLPLRPVPSDVPAPPPGAKLAGPVGRESQEEHGPCLMGDSRLTGSCPGGRQGRRPDPTRAGTSTHTGGQPWPLLQRPSSLRPQHHSVNQETEPSPGLPALPGLQPVPVPSGCVRGRHPEEDGPCHQPCLLPALPAEPLAVTCREFHNPRTGCPSAQPPLQPKQTGKCRLDSPG